MDEPQPQPQPAQGPVSLGVAGMVGGICLALAFLAHDPRYEAWERAFRWDEAARSRHMFVPIGHIKSDPDRVLNEEFPALDVRAGGVYFFGTSNLQWGLKLWALPGPQRALIHNLAVNSVGHEGQFLLIRYLVEREGLLRAGPEKTLVVFGASYHNAGSPESDDSSLARLLALHGFYTRGRDGAIARSGATALERALVLEKLRIHGIADELAHLAFYALKDRLGRPRRRVLMPDEGNATRSLMLGSNWKEKIETEVATLLRALDYLRARRVPVVVVLMPHGTWEERLPFARAYDEPLIAGCRARGVEVRDLRGLLDDEDFADSNHPNTWGDEKLQAAVLPFCLEFLRATGHRAAADGR